jgi:hypothetical protein
MSDETMNADDDEMRDEYDFSTGGVVGKYFEDYQEWKGYVRLDPDVAREFPDSESVNRALRRVIKGRRARSGQATGASTRAR